MEKENIKTPKERKSKLRKTQKMQANRCRKVQLKPSPEISNIFRKWFGCVRNTYNWALGCIKNKPREYKVNMVWLRKRFINACNIPREKKYLLDTPKHIRDTAINDLVEGIKSNKTKKAKDPNFKFDMKFRKRKDHQSISILRESIKEWNVSKEEISLYPTFLKNKIKFHCRNVPKEIAFDTKLTMDKLGRFYLCIPSYEAVCENQTNLKHDWCSLDPGVRSFMTLYSPTHGICYKIGNGDISRIFRLCKGLDKLLQKKKTWRIGRAQKRLRFRIKNLVDEVHWKTIHFLTTNFKNIILPPFEVSQMVKRKNRKLRKKTVRQMLCWRHYTFKMRLQDYVSRLEDTKLYIRGEEYTSKTCTSCLNIKHNLGGSKIYKCKHCNVIVDRDNVGARNIFIKNASLCCLAA
jgi:putative transposase